MRNLLLLGAGILGVMIYRNAARASEKTPNLVTAKRGDSPLAPDDVSRFKLASPAFRPGQRIPIQYSCEGPDKNFPLTISGAPEGTQSFAIIMEDLDSPMPPVFDHWLVWNIPADTTYIPEGRLPEGAVQGKNTLQNNRYNGPCTPNGTHNYHIKLFALDCLIELPEGTSKRALKAAMKKHILAQCDLIGTYTANRTTVGNLMLNTMEAVTRV